MCIQLSVFLCSEGRPPPRCFPVHGTLKNTNTIDELKTCDKKALLDEQAEKVVYMYCNIPILECVGMELYIDLRPEVEPSDKITLVGP